MGILTKAADLIKTEKVKVIGQTDSKIILQVGEYEVIFIKKSGRTLDSCSCENHARFCNENPRCSHKLAAATYIVMRRIKWN